MSAPDAPTTTTPRLAVGTRFGAYEVTALRHVGERVEVYAATRDGRPCALKLPSARRALEPGHVERFRLEAESAALLRHAHLVPVREVGEVGGVPFLCTDLLTGETLGERLKARGAFAFPEAVDLLLPLLSALVLVRERNVAHGEVKARNVFLTEGAHAWLLDVGVVKQEPVDDRRRDARSVGPLFHAVLAGEDRARDWTPSTLEASLRALRVPPDLADALARAEDDRTDTLPASTRELGRALSPYASVAVRDAWGPDFVAAPRAPGRDVTPVGLAAPRSAQRAVGLLVALLLVIVGVWVIRDRIRPAMHMPINDRRPVASP